MSDCCLVCVDCGLKVHSHATPREGECEEECGQINCDHGSKRGCKRAGMDSLRWIQTSNGELPPFAVTGGVDIEKEVAYVGRARCENSLLPGRVVPKEGNIYVALDGSECTTKCYEVLTNPQNAPLKWIYTKAGGVLPGAVLAGHHCGETLYIGRRVIAGDCYLGTVYSRTHDIEVPMCETALHHTDYELLVCEE